MGSPDVSLRDVASSGGHCSSLASVFVCSCVTSVFGFELSLGGKLGEVGGRGSVTTGK